MQQLTPAGQNVVNEIAARYNLSYDAVVHMLIAVNNGGGSMAQFNCPELGGSGQWMQGGMTMVGDMFNYSLKMTVDNLCNELANALANTQMFPPTLKGSRGGNQWWPGELGSPFSSGAQNNIRYAVFPQRLAIELNGQITIYDTLDHNIGGISQQQGGDTSLTFSSQYGTVAVTSLPVISGPGLAPAPQTNFALPLDTAPTSFPAPGPEFNVPAAQLIGATTQNTPLNQAVGSQSANDIISLIEKLAHLRDAGALTDDEFNAKKSDLLNKI